MVPGLTPERSASSLIFSRPGAPFPAPPSPASGPVTLFVRVATVTSASRPQRRGVLSLGGPRRGAGLQQVRDLRLGVARREQRFLGVLAERRPGKAAVLAGSAGQLDRNSELANGPLGARLLELHHHLTLAHELGLERLVELEQRLQAAVVAARELLPVRAGAALENLPHLVVRGGAGPLELLRHEVLALDAPAPRLPELP